MGQVFRIWAHLAAVRRRGQAHGIDNIMTERRKNSLAVRCPACPEVGVNVQKVTLELASEHEAYMFDHELYINTQYRFRHKYTLFISADGNFRLQHKHKKDDPDNVALNAGNGYFVETAGYQYYLLHVGDCTDVRCLPACHCQHN